MNESTNARRPENADDSHYGTGHHYEGQLGEEYFAWQGPLSNKGAQIEARKFSGFVSKDDSVLDFGCGSAKLLELLDCAGKVGVEVNPAARTEALRRGITCFPDLGSIPDDSIDVVITNHVLEHVPNSVEALTQLRQKLKPGGRAVICVPIEDWRSHKRYTSADRNHHLHTWTVQLLGNTLTEAGFDVNPDQIRVLTQAWPPGFSTLDRMVPRWVFNFASRTWATVRRRRQIIATAVK